MAFRGGEFKDLSIAELPPKKIKSSRLSGAFWLFLQGQDTVISQRVFFLPLNFRQIRTEVL
jgi:hypothetical protein